MTTPDSTPLRNEVEQPVPHQIQTLLDQIREPHYDGETGTTHWTLTNKEATALILAAMERFAEQKLQQSRKFWEDSTRDALRSKDQQLAALQRENESTIEKLKTVTEDRDGLVELNDLHRDQIYLLCDVLRKHNLKIPALSIPKSP